MESYTSRNLANWILRLNAKGEASGREGDLRRVALVTCAKSVAEVQLYRQQRARTRSGSGNGSNGNGIGRSNRLKRLHSSSSFSSDCSSGSVASSGPAAMGGGCAGGAGGVGGPSMADSDVIKSGSCVCDDCSLCSTYQAAGANSCYCRATGYAVAGFKPKANLLSDDEESRLIDDFLTSLDGVPSNKKCKRLWSFIFVTSMERQFVILFFYLWRHLNSNLLDRGDRAQLPTSRHLFIYLRDIHAATWRLYSDWRETIFKASYFFLPLYIFSVLTHQRLSTPTAQINFERVVFAYIGPSPCESPSPLLLKQYHVRERERTERLYTVCPKL